jgi:hypothetical protein
MLEHTNILSNIELVKVQLCYSVQRFFKDAQPGGRLIWKMGKIESSYLNMSDKEMRPPIPNSVKCIEQT